MMPTKPISPLTATAAAVPSVAAMTTVSRTPADPQPREQPPVGKEQRGSDGGVRQDDEHLGPRGERKAAEDPRVDLLQVLRVLLLQIGLHGGEQGRYRHAGQDDRGGGTAAGGTAAGGTAIGSTGAAGPRPQQVSDRDGGDGAPESGRGQQRLARPGDNDDRRAQPAAGGHAEQVRVSERVAEHTLVSRSTAGQ